MFSPHGSLPRVPTRGLRGQGGSNRMQRVEDIEEIIERVAAIDVGKAEVVVCIRIPDPSLSRFPCKPRVTNTINLSQGESSGEEDHQRVQRCFPAVSSSSRFPSSLAGNVAQPEVE